MQQPNILLITSDQHHWTALGAINDEISTPNLDRLCAQGTRFSRAYCPNPTCTPTRASIITGQYPSTHGAWTLGTKLPEDAPTVGEIFHANGYRTFLIGKAHFQPTKSAPDQTSVECLPTLRDLDFWRTFNDTQTPWYGFDHVELARNHADEALVGQHYAIWLEEQGVENWRDYFQDVETFQPKRFGEWDLPAKYHYTTWTAQRTIAQIEAATASQTPFFGWASFHDPHPPYVVPQPWAQMYDPKEMEPGTLLENEMELLPEHFRLTQAEKPDFSSYNESGQTNHGFHSHLTSDEKGRQQMAIYYGMVSFMDEQIGRILDALEEQGIAENTMIVFTTDHGHFLGQHGLWFKGAFHYEDVLRVPFIASWPGHIASGAENDALQSLVDLAPTFLAACDIPIPGAMQGVNQLPVWKGEQEKAREEVIVEFRHQPTRVHLRTLITDRFKMTIYRDQNYGELFDLHDDPDERCNLWGAVAASGVKAEMFEKLAYAEMRREPTALSRIAGA